MKVFRTLLFASVLFLASGCNKEENGPTNETPKPYEVYNVNGVEFKMIKVDPGTFTMGATPEQEDHENLASPTHEVTLTKTYYMGETEVTQELWKAVMGTDSNPDSKDLTSPATLMSFTDITDEFLPKLSELTGVTFSLPTEAQWEYAARGGNKTKGFKFSGSNNVDEVAWHCGNADKIQPVAQKLPNELGLYDMSGNVLEWCSDWFAFYTADPQTDPEGPAEALFRVVRSGCIAGDSSQQYIAFRSTGHPSMKNFTIGFRLAIVL